MERVNDSNLYQITLEDERFFPIVFSTFQYRILGTQDNGRLVFISPSRTIKTGKVVNFATVSRNCTWIRRDALEVVNA